MCKYKLKRWCRRWKRVNVALKLVKNKTTPSMREILSKNCIMCDEKLSLPRQNFPWIFTFIYFIYLPDEYDPMLSQSELSESSATFESSSSLLAWSVDRRREKLIKKFHLGECESIYCYRRKPSGCNFTTTIILPPQWVS